MVLVACYKKYKIIDKYKQYYHDLVIAIIYWENFELSNTPSFYYNQVITRNY